MSINVTVNGNSLNIRRGRMVLSDLEQIKKNERDRRRRLRLEQVRQQSKEISNRLLKRTKNIVKEELQKLDTYDKLNLKQAHIEKIMEVQQKYQEDMADIGEAHLSARLECNHNALIEEKSKNNKLTAIKRGKEAEKHIKDVQQETTQHLHQERLRHVRELEDLRSKMITKLHQGRIPDELAVCNSAQKKIDGETQYKSAKKKTKKLFSKKSPGKISKPYIRIVGESGSKTSEHLAKSGSICVDQQSVADSIAVPSTSKSPVITAETEQIVHIPESEINGKNSTKIAVTSSTTPTKSGKIARYNPEDYRPATNSNLTSTDSSNSISDDSSYFSDSGEQYKCIRTSKYVSCPAKNEMPVRDKSNHQINIHDKPVNVVEKIYTSNEPSAIYLAQEIGQVEMMDTQAVGNHVYCVQKRGEDAVLREKVRRDYKALMQNLNQLAREERKLKASQIECYSKNVHMQDEWAKILRDQRKKKLDCAVKTLLNEDCLEQCASYPMERQITLTPRENDDVDTHVWRESCSVNEHAKINKNLLNNSKEGENSREEQILDMLKKVEKQKQLLLQEFGSDLPDDIFNATTKPLFEKEKSIQVQSGTPQDTQILEPLSPEIKVINTHCDKDIKKGNIQEKDNSPIKKVEIAVQTTNEDKIDTVQDKSIQVELTEEKISEVQPANDETEITTKHYPLEPKITVITPEMDSSGSTTSMATDVVLDAKKQDRKTIFKKKKSYIKTFKQSPSKMFKRGYSTSVNETVSPVKRVSKSSQKSRHNIISKTNYGVVDTPSKRIKIYVGESGFNIKVKPPQTAEVAVDVSTQNSQVNETQTEEQFAGKSHWIQARSKSIQIKDTSDASTSFASLPPIKPRDLLEVLNNNISILEMLDSSANESMMLLRRDVSPVSTPETPSPRTMRMPSNMPHPDRLGKMFRYGSTDSQVTDNSVLSSIKNDRSTSIDLSDYSKQPSEFCLCKNPECKLMHAKFDDIRNYALKNCPHILQKYEDLQTTCAERIVSLTNLIEKVRNEQEGMELSAINGGDETSSIQFSSPKLMTNDLQNVRKLVENIEAIHNQLVKTLIESQQIIKNKNVLEEEGATQTKEIEVANVTNGSISKNIIDCIEPKAEVRKTKAKPKIISEEKVNIQLNRFKMQHKPQILMKVSPEQNSCSPSKFHDELMIEKLSKEILEQSKGFSSNSVQTKQIDKPAVKHTIQTSTDFNYFKNDTSSQIHKTDTDIEKQKQSRKNADFVPLLADIPKISRTVENTVLIAGRNKPPVSILSGPYRADIEASGHELSTIIEFDTPDTVNKSQNNVKSPSSIKKITETQLIKSVITVKPSETVTPSFNSHNQHFKELNDPLITKVGTSLVSAHRLKETSMRFGSKDFKSVQNKNSMENKNEKQKGIPRETNNNEKHKGIIRETTKSEKQKGITQETNKNEKHVGVTQEIKNEKQGGITREENNIKLQYNTDNQELLNMKELQSISPFGTDVNSQYKNKDKITSTSSNSFSGLSGISQIASTPSSDVLKYASSPEDMEIALKKLGLGWAIATLKKTRQASALSSSSNSDVTPVNTAKRISPVKKHFDSKCGLPDFSDVSSISIKEASKSTEQAVLLKGRTSTPKMQNSNSNSVRTNSSNTNNSENLQDLGDDLIIPNISLTKSKSNVKNLENLT